MLLAVGGVARGLLLQSQQAPMVSGTKLTQKTVGGLLKKEDNTVFFYSHTVTYGLLVMTVSQITCSGWKSFVKSLSFKCFSRSSPQ